MGLFENEVKPLSVISDSIADVVILSDTSLKASIDFQIGSESASAGAVGSTGQLGGAVGSQQSKSPGRDKVIARYSFTGILLTTYYLLTYYLLLTTYYLLTYHLLLATYPLPFTTHHVPLITYYLLLTTYHLSVTTYYLLTTYLLLIYLLCISPHY